MRTIACKEYVETGHYPETVPASRGVRFCDVTKTAVEAIGVKKTGDVAGNAPHVVQEGGEIWISVSDGEKVGREQILSSERYVDMQRVQLH